MNLFSQTELSEKKIERVKDKYFPVTSRDFTNFDEHPPFYVILPEENKLKNFLGKYLFVLIKYLCNWSFKVGTKYLKIYFNFSNCELPEVAGCFTRLNKKSLFGNDSFKRVPMKPVQYALYKRRAEGRALSRRRREWGSRS